MQKILFSLVILFSSIHSFALDTTNMLVGDMGRMGLILQQNASDTQWQALYRGMNERMTFLPSGTQARFAIPVGEIRPYLSTALSNQMPWASQKTKIWYIYYPDQVTGYVNNQPVYGICVLADFKKLAAKDIMNASAYRVVDLLYAEPCIPDYPLPLY